MLIVLSEESDPPTKLQPRPVRYEKRLQTYISENPECLALDDYKDDIQLLTLAREFQVATGAIDILAVDQDGEVYLIETKLDKNTDKRFVLAQVLDYGASFWKTYASPEQFIAHLRRVVGGELDSSLREMMREAFGFDEEELDEILGRIGDNVVSGNFRFVVPMDRIDEHLKNLIAYVNENSQFDVFGVELEFYRHGELEILAPKLFGAEIEKPKGSSRIPWDEESFFKDAESRLGKDAVASIRRLYAWALEHADQVDWGTGAKRGSFNPKFNHVSQRSVFSVYSDGTLKLNFNWLDDDERAEENSRRLGGQIQQHLPGLKLPRNFESQFISFAVEEWGPKSDELTQVFKLVLVEQD